MITFARGRIIRMSTYYSQLIFIRTEIRYTVSKIYVSKKQDLEKMETDTIFGGGILGNPLGFVAYSPRGLCGKGPYIFCSQQSM